MGVTRMNRNYLLYVAFYSFIQDLASRERDLGLDGAGYETYVQSELDRVAQTVIHSISADRRMDDEE
jgi:hypothetical protein